MSTLSEPIVNAIKDVKRAKLMLKQARERLAAEILTTGRLTCTTTGPGPMCRRHYTNTNISPDKE